MDQKGYSNEEAIKIVKNIQSENGKKSYQGDKRKDTITNCFIPEFWNKKGYSDTETEALIAEMKFRVSGSKERYIEKYGVEDGTLLHKQRYTKAKETRIKNFGAPVPAGRASKASLKFFIPLYKKIRKLGIQKDDILWGITGSREFATCYEGRNFFYDFTIKSLKLVIEFHGTFWHPREPEEWLNSSYYDYDSKKMYDEIKKRAIIDRGFEYCIVWSDDNFNVKNNDIISYIKG